MKSDFMGFKEVKHSFQDKLKKSGLTLHIFPASYPQSEDEVIDNLSSICMIRDKGRECENQNVFSDWSDIYSWHNGFNTENPALYLLSEKDLIKILAEKYSEELPSSEEAASLIPVLENLRMACIADDFSKMSSRLNEFLLIVKRGSTLSSEESFDRCFFDDFIKNSLDKSSSSEFSHNEKLFVAGLVDRYGPIEYQYRLSPSLKHVYEEVSDLMDWKSDEKKEETLSTIEYAIELTKNFVNIHKKTFGGITSFLQAQKDCYRDMFGAPEPAAYVLFKKGFGLEPAKEIKSLEDEPDGIILIHSNWVGKSDPVEVVRKDLSHMLNYYNEIGIEMRLSDSEGKTIDQALIFYGKNAEENGMMDTLREWEKLYIIPRLTPEETVSPTP